MQSNRCGWTGVRGRASDPGHRDNLEKGQDVIATANGREGRGRGPVDRRPCIPAGGNKYVQKVQLLTTVLYHPRDRVDEYRETGS